MEMNDVIKYDLEQLTKHRWSHPYFVYSYFMKKNFKIVYLFRKSSGGVLKNLYRFRYKRFVGRMGIKIPVGTTIGKGLTLGHPSSIVVNSKAIIGEDVSISHGVTIGLVKSGKREGVPVIGNHVYIGAGAAIVGGINIGDNVLIAANSFIDFDVPSDSLVFGNPGIIKAKIDAVKDYH